MVSWEAKLRQNQEVSDKHMRCLSQGWEKNVAFKGIQPNPQLFYFRISKNRNVFLCHPDISSAFLPVKELLPNLGNSGCFAGGSYSDQQGTSARNRTCGLGCTSMHLDFTSFLQTLPAQKGLTAVTVPRAVVIHFWLLLLGLSWEDGSHIVSFALSKSGGKSSKDHRAWIQEIKNSLERELENVNPVKQPSSGPRFIDSNKSCMSNYMNENLFSKRQLLWGHCFVNNNNRNAFMLDSKKRIC